MTIKDKYGNADKYVVLNENDPDLTPIVLTLPEPPPLKTIDGYGLPIEEQRFSRLNIPRRLIDLEAEAVAKTKEDLSTNKNNVVTLLKIQKKFWELLYSRHKELKKEITFIRRVWWHRTFGFWFMNRGKPVFISGWHFFYLNFWTMDVRKKVDFPDYRERDRKEFLFKLYQLTTTETFARLDDEGHAIKEEDGSYEMIDTGNRLCYGGIQPKNRRSGNTNKALSDGIEMLTRTIGTDGMGIQSYSEDNAGSHFRDKMMPAFFRLPIWLQPYTTSGRTSNLLKLDTSKNDYGDKGLGTLCDYATTASSKFYDGKKKKFLLTDEAGKCFGEKTKIRMYDGSVKNVENIKVGDVLMGNNSTPRNVLSLHRGVDDMYRVIPNKGESWTCNKEHILCLKGSDNGVIYGVRKGYEFNKTVKDFIRMKPNQKRASVMYRKHVSFQEQYHSLDPYFVGLWLGDGSSSYAAITNVDEEVTDYLYDFAKIHDLNVTITGGITYSLGAKSDNLYVLSNSENEITFSSYKEIANHFGITYGSVSWSLESGKEINGYSVLKQKVYNATSELRSINILKNKHIPRSYIMDSRHNRMQLLAGLIDSDGYAATGTKMAYEVTQKRKQLAYDIRRVALDLGYYSSINSKIARMKREDGSVYECEVWRVMIYGNNLWEIPCKVKRKKYHKKRLHSNTRNPLHTGFSIESIGIGDYYGFEVDGNRKFLLEDNTVVHNTSSITDVSERHEINKHVIAQGDGSDIHGFMEYPSTVEELKEGAFHYRKLAETSNFFIRLPNGQTESGLFALFVPADEGLDKHIDSYGYDIKGEIKPYQKEEGFKKTSTEHIQSRRDFLLKKGDSESMVSYRNYKKLFPMKYMDCFLGESGDIGFNLEKIDIRQAELRRVNPSVKGNFEWVGGVFGGDVEWIPDEENGRVTMGEKPYDHVINKKVQVNAFNPLTGKNELTYRPLYASNYVVGVDTFNFLGKAQIQAGKGMTKSSKHSDGGLSVLLKYNPSIDKGKPMDEWETHKLVLAYRNRHGTTYDFNEDVLKVCLYYSGMLFPEMNLTNTYEYFLTHGYGGYMLYSLDKFTGQYKDKPGVHSLEGSKQEIFTALRDYIEHRIHVDVMYEFQQECKEIKEMSAMRHYDLLASAGVALIGAQSQYAEEMLSDEQKENNLEDYLDVFNV